MGEVAVTILADASVALKLHWQKATLVLGALLGRLREGKTPDQMHLNFVVYATADYRPTPILTKRYFANFQPELLRELFNEQQKLGLGCSGSGGKQGMSALEGYTAALELYDYFIANKPTGKEGGPDGLLCHIIHISASKADELVNPMWNQTTVLDHITWKTLPEELRKRNINLSLIMFKSDDRFQELHTSLSPEPCKLWFTPPLQAECSVKLSSTSSWASARPLEVKTEEKAKENKTEESKSRQAPTPAASNATPAPTPPQNTAPPPSVPMSHIQSIYQNYKKQEEELIRIREQILLLSSKGRSQEANALKKAAEPKVANLNHLRQTIANILQQKHATAGNQSSTAVPGTTSSGTTTTSNNQTATTGPSQASPMTRTQQQPKANSQPGDVGQINPPAGLPGNMPLNASLAAQMQKLVGREGIQGTTLMSSMAQKAQEIAQQKQNTVNQSAAYTAPLAEVQSQPTNNGRDPKKWVGTLVWQSPQTGERKRAVVECLGNSDIRPELWPRELDLKISNDRISLDSLRRWLDPRKSTVPPCRFTPITQVGAENQTSFETLSRFLADTRCYAACTWVKDRPTVLFFASEPSKLAGLISPETGFHDLPQADLGPMAQTGPPQSQMPMTAMPPAARAAVPGAVPGSSSSNFPLSSAAPMQAIMARLATLPPEQQKIEMARVAGLLGAARRGAGMPVSLPGQQPVGGGPMNANMGGQMPLNAIQLQMAAGFGVGGLGEAGQGMQGQSVPGQGMQGQGVQGTQGQGMQGIQGPQRLQGLQAMHARLQAMQATGRLPPGTNLHQLIAAMQQHQQQQQQLQQQQNSFPGMPGAPGFGGQPF